ncbi:MAG: class I SAM-dependent methyltransferase, partial [Burkholderiaceae bacterium]
DILMGQSLEFWNYGYWTPDTENPAKASMQLMDYLIGKFPRHTKKVLDVAFGKGSSTIRLCELFGTENVIGINIAPNQVELARQRGAACELKVMDAAQLEFEPGRFDGILCMEAAFHFIPDVLSSSEPTANWRPTAVS